MGVRVGTRTLDTYFTYLLAFREHMFRHIDVSWYYHFVYKCLQTSTSAVFCAPNLYLVQLEVIT